MAAQKNGSEQELGNGIFSHPPSSTFFSKGICLKHDGKVSIGGRIITILRLADDIDALVEEEQGLKALGPRL